VRNLESVLDEMHKAAENRREIERQHKEALVRALFNFKVKSVSGNPHGHKLFDCVF
jgi:hypothetical protein